MKKEQEVNEMKEPEIIELLTHNDDRGMLVSLTQELPDDLDKEIKRIYTVSNFSKGTVRGWHFHKFETKIFYVAKGAVKFLAIDPNDNENYHEAVLSEKSSELFIVPPGYKNGWVSLTEETLVIVLSTSTFEESKNDDVRTDPYENSDLWKVEAR